MESENRRSFVKKSLATSMTFTFSGLIRAHGEEGGETTTYTTIPDTLGTDDTTEFTADSTVPETLGTDVATGPYWTGYRHETLTQYRVICYEAPASGATVISWAQANARDASNPESISVRAITTGPARGGASLSVLSGESNFTYSVDGQNFPGMAVTKRVSKELEFQSAPYTGQWLTGSNGPSIVTKKTNESAQPADSGIVYGIGGEIGHTLTVNKAGVFLSALAITGGNNIETSQSYSTSDGKSSDTREGAEGTLALPDVDTSAEASPKSISGKTVIKNKTGITIASEGTLQTTSQYNRNVGQNNAVAYTYNGTCTSSVTGSGTVQFLVMLQSRKKTVTYKVFSDGSEQLSDSGDGNETAWGPEMPEPQQ